MRRAASSVLLALCPVALAASGGVSERWRGIYDELVEWRYTAAPVALETGTAWSVEGARFALDRGGELFVGEPVAGRPTGVVYAGPGRFELPVTDVWELAQLKRFAADPALEMLAADFNLLVARSSEAAWLPQSVVPAAGPYAPQRAARERHAHWLRVRRPPPPAPPPAARREPGDRYFRADMKTANGWLTFDFDPRRDEPLRVEKFRGKRAIVEHWLSLPLPAPGARPGAIDLEHLEARASFLGLGKDPGVGPSARYTLRGELEARVRLVPARGGAGAVTLELDPMAEVTGVADATGRELSFLRAHIGGRSRALDNRLHDDALVVLLDSPLAAAQALELTVRYRLDTGNFVHGRDWYPTPDDGDGGPADLHTAGLEIVTRDVYDIRAMGRRIEETVAHGRRVARWRVERPVKMVTFTFARRMEERRFEDGAAPRVVVFAPPVGHDTDNRLARLGGGVHQSLGFFEELFDEPLPARTLYATLIQAAHGQAFEGFLQLADASAYRGRAGTNELFLAHEVAHQWWGHLVGWKSYRDQWLSEALAEYSAMMYVERNVEDGEKIFREILRAYRDELNGSIASRLSGFSRFALAKMHRGAERRIGPIGHGFRAATAEAPAAYYSQTYHKGALVLHMLRRLLSFSPAGEDAFVDVLRIFVDRHRGGAASTADLQAAVERRVPGDWSWFFDQWVRRAEIPAYRFRSRELADGGGGHRLEVTVRQDEVPEDFRMSVPLRAEFTNGETQEVLIDVEGPETVVTLAFDERPARLVFNPDDAVLSRRQSG